MLYVFTLKYINLTKYMAKGSGYKFVNLVTALPLQDKANTFMFVKESMWCELVVTRI